MYIWNIEKQNNASDKTKPVTNSRNLTIESVLQVRGRNRRKEKLNRKHWTMVEDLVVGVF